MVLSQWWAFWEYFSCLIFGVDWLSPPIELKVEEVLIGQWMSPGSNEKRIFVQTGSVSSQEMY